MYSRLAFLRLVAAALVSLAGLNEMPIQGQSPSQSPTTEQHQHPAATPAPEHEGHDIQMAREGPGTAWLPDTTPMYAIHWQRGPWQFMAHESVFIQFLYDSGDRGDINSEVLPASVAAGRLKLGEVRLDPGTTKNLEGRVFYWRVASSI